MDGTWSLADSDSDGWYDDGTTDGSESSDGDGLDDDAVDFEEIYVEDASGDDLMIVTSDGTNTEIMIIDPSGDDAITLVDTDPPAEATAAEDTSADTASVEDSSSEDSAGEDSEVTGSSGTSADGTGLKDANADTAGYAEETVDDLGSSPDSGIPDDTQPASFDAATQYPYAANAPGSDVDWSSMGSLGSTGPLLDETEALLNDTQALLDNIDAETATTNPYVPPVSGDTAALLNQINSQMQSVSETVDWAEQLPTDTMGSGTGGEGTSTPDTPDYSALEGYVAGQEMWNDVMSDWRDFESNPGEVE